MFRLNLRESRAAILSDSSLEQICIVTYLCSEDDEAVEVSLIIGQCKLTPTIHRTIPMLDMWMALYSVTLRKEKRKTMISTIELFYVSHSRRQYRIGRLPHTKGNKYEKPNELKENMVIPH